MNSILEPYSVDRTNRLTPHTQWARRRECRFHTMNRACTLEPYSLNRIYYLTPYTRWARRRECRFHTVNHVYILSHPTHCSESLLWTYVYSHTLHSTRSTLHSTPSSKIPLSSNLHQAATCDWQWAARLKAAGTVWTVCPSRRRFRNPPRLSDLVQILKSQLTGISYIECGSALNFQNLYLTQRVCGGNCRTSPRKYTRCSSRSSTTWCPIYMYVYYIYIYINTRMCGGHCRTSPGNTPIAVVGVTPHDAL